MTAVAALGMVFSSSQFCHLKLFISAYLEQTSATETATVK